MLQKEVSIIYWSSLARGLVLSSWGQDCCIGESPAGLAVEGDFCQVTTRQLCSQTDTPLATQLECTTSRIRLNPATAEQVLHVQLFSAK